MYKLPPSTIRSRLASARRKLRMYYPELENQKK
jgi:RNA polymerase sigma-70 factor (ECF subfamily)